MSKESNPTEGGEPHSQDSHGHTCDCGHSHAAQQVRHETEDAAAPKMPTPACCGHDHGHAHEPSCCGHAHPSPRGPDAAAAAETESRFFFSLETLVLLMWAAALVCFVTSGRVTHFLAPTGWFREQALVGGLALAVLAVFNWLMRRRFPGFGHQHGHEHEEDGSCPGGHVHAHEESTWLGRAVSILLLAAPVSLAAAFSPNDWSSPYKAQLANSLAASNAPASGKSSLSPQTSAPGGADAYTLEDLKKQVDLSPEGNFVLPITSLWSVAGDAVVRPVISGQSVETIGQVVKDSSNPARLRAFELMVSCCAADAKPVSFPLDFGSEKLPDYREMGWYKIVGTIGFEDERGGKVTVLKVKSLTPWSRPNASGPMY